MKHVSFILLSSLFLTACENTAFREEAAPKTLEEERRSSFGKVFGEEFLIFGGPGSRKNIDQTPIGNINAHLWRASLDTLNFMPLASTDSVGGIIITEWFSPQNNPQERFKVTVKILDKTLETTSLKVIVHKQVQKGSQWASTQPSPDMAQKLETIILSKARENRVATTPEKR